MTKRNTKYLYMRNEMLDNLHGKTNKNRDVTASKQNIMRNIMVAPFVKTVFSEI